ncbi:hypothetical protein GGR56DRAFT_669142 [Xylariaceae sp. FL0804]|nr:hypothetical protein GGR56DRAFT_669142 [Xylariaceae sp. FL0804]
MSTMWTFARAGAPPSSSSSSSSSSSPPRQEDPTQELDDDDDDDWDSEPASAAETETHRVVFGAQSTQLYGYPSSGGALRFRSGPGDGDDAAEEEEEDRHCARARVRRSGTSSPRSERLARRRRVVAAWPQRQSQGGGGVWVVTAEDRCEVVERLGGRYYSDPKQCPDLEL